MQKRISKGKGAETMIQKRLVNMSNQADVASCVPQALPGRRVGVLRDLNAWEATRRPCASAGTRLWAGESGTQTTRDRDVGTLRRSGRWSGPRRGGLFASVLWRP